VSTQVVTRTELVTEALEHITKGKLVPGTLIELTTLESLLGVSRDTQAFGFMVSEIRHSLFELGKYLSGEGLEQKQAYEILHERDNHWIARLAMARMDRSLSGMQSLLSHTDITSLSKLEQDRHDNALREVAMRMRVFKSAQTKLIQD